MIFSKLSLICMFKDKSLAEKWTNLAENLKKIGFCRTRRTHFLQLCYKVKAWKHLALHLVSAIVFRQELNATIKCNYISDFAAYSTQSLGKKIIIGWPKALHRKLNKQGSSENDGRSDVFYCSEFKVISNCCYTNCCRTNCGNCYLYLPECTCIYLNLPEYT